MAPAPLSPADALPTFPAARRAAPLAVMGLAVMGAAFAA